MKVTQFLVNVELPSKIDATNSGADPVLGGHQYAMFSVTVPYTGDSHADSREAERIALENCASVIAISSSPIGTYAPQEKDKK